MRRAEWRKRADDPKSALGWWWRGIVEEDRLLGIQIIGLSATCAAWIAGLHWAMAPLAITWILGKVVQRERKPDRLGPLLPEPAPEGHIRAGATYRREGLTTGRDPISLVAVDGWLVAEGLRSDFALRREDVLDLRTGSDRRGWLRLSDESTIELTGLDDPARVVLERWWAAKALVVGEPVLPPSRVHPQELARWGAWLFAGLGVLALTLIIPFVVPKGPIHMVAILAVYGVGGSAMALGYRNLDRLAKIVLRDREVLAGQAPPLQ